MILSYSYLGKRLPAVTAIHRVIDRAGILDSELSHHACNGAKSRGPCQRSMIFSLTDPFFDPFLTPFSTEDGRPAPWRRFFARDPFGNRLEIHEPGGLRA